MEGRREGEREEGKEKGKKKGKWTLQLAEKLVS